MMDKVCTAANNLLIKIILGLIVILLVLTEARNYFLYLDNNYAAKVNGQKISYLQLEQAVQNALNRQQTSIVNKFYRLAVVNHEGYMQQIRQQMLSQLIDKILLDQYADKLDITISDDQIKQAILAITDFKTDNKFDSTKFLAFIHNMGLTSNQYAAFIEKQLLTKQLIQSIGHTYFLIPEETNLLLAILVQTREARLATFNIASIATKQSISRAEIKDRYNLHNNKYRSPELFKISYILIEAQNNELNIHAKHDNIIQSQTNNVNHWLDKLQQGANFDALAEAAGIPINKTGWFSRYDVPIELNDEAVKQVLFDCSTSGKNCAISSDYDIITVDSNRAVILNIAEHKTEIVQPLDTVRSQIEQELKRQKALDKAQLDASKILVALKQGKCDEASKLKSFGLILSKKQHFDSLDQDSSLAHAVFMLPKPVHGKSSYGIAKDDQDNIIIISLDSVMPRQLNDEQHHIFVEQLNQGMINIIFDVLLHNLRSAGKIKIGTVT